MEYTIKKLSLIAGISRRTLRYYDEINLLKPKRINSSGYRIYGEDEINLLQEIMIYKSMGMSLSDIENLVKNKNYNTTEVLSKHLEKLILKRRELENLINNVEKTIKNRKGELEMSNKEKFEILKKKMIDKNERLYGKESREKYGEDTLNKSNDKILNLTEKEYDDMERTEEKIFSLLRLVKENGNYDAEEAKELFEAHKTWLMFTWKEYSKEKHLVLSKMYLYDERFVKYYDEKIGEGATEALVKVIEIFTK